MPETAQDFCSALTGSGLMSADELRSALAQFKPQEREDSQAVAQAFFSRGKLTAYQAKELLAGRIAGLVLGNYVILDRLGAGGMGVVYKAQQRRMKRICALKMLPQHVVHSEEALRRFLREVEAAARLEHPNIVTAYDADEANGTYFLAMQYVEGSDLAHYVRRCGKLTIRKSIDYTLQAARGIHYAHQKGVIHRDIKPGNLLLDTEGVVRVLDMGLARLEQQPGEELSAFQTQDDLTGTGRVIGTVDYMAPEQTLDARHVDKRADIYSLGCTLHFLLTGRTPVPDGSLTEKLLWHESGPIPSLLDVRPDVPPELNVVFHRMMARKPQDRYPTMGEVIEQLGICLAALPDVPEETLPIDGQIEPIVPPTEAVVIPEMVTEEKSAPPPIQAPPESHPPRSGETQRSEVRPDATVVEKLVGRSRQSSRRKEKQAWLVAGGVIGIGLLGGLVLWVMNFLQTGPAGWADWNEEVKAEIIDAHIVGGVNSPHGRRLYSEVMTVLDNGDSGNWLLGRGITKEGVPKYIRFRGASYDVRTVSADEARRNNLADDEIQSNYNKALENREELLATLQRPQLSLVTDPDGKVRLRGRVDCRPNGTQTAADVTLQLHARDAQGVRSVEPLATQTLQWSDLLSGTLSVDVVLKGSAPAGGDEIELSLHGFLYQPKPAIYRISNQASCRLTQ